MLIILSRLAKVVLTLSPILELLALVRTVALKGIRKVVSLAKRLIKRKGKRNDRKIGERVQGQVRKRKEPKQGRDVKESSQETPPTS